MLDQHEERLKRARVSLEGLSVGDGFGDQFFTAYNALNYIEYRAMPLQYWRYTDDTNMALSIYSVLRRRGEIDQDMLAGSFAKQYHPSRGYGPAMHGLLGQIQLGIPWQMAATGLFSGQGSYGNGAAMRVAPLGAYFADDLDAAVLQAHHSSEITHAHSEGIAGAIAVAIATGIAWRFREEEKKPSRKEFIDQILPYVPDSIVHEKIRHARDLADGCSVGLAIAALGNGTGVSAQDTVPFVLWCAGERLNNYEEALWLTASGMGDVDTTCAMVGGIVSLYTGLEGIPSSWIESREPLPDWAFTE
jgi:ADP-ribosylglycohydrolase